jgi:hypothetical protein
MPLVYSTAALQSACFGAIGTALPPALSSSGLEPAAVAMVLGRIGSASALAEVLLSGSFGSFADAAGRTQRPPNGTPLLAEKSVPSSRREIRPR